MCHRLDFINGHRKHARRELSSGGREVNLALMTADAQNNTDVVAQVGGTATIRCYTQFLGDELVTWLKRDDEQILTAGQHVYSSEHRYSVSHVRHHKLWELTLRKVQPSDAGVYECQLTSHPPISLFFNLQVVEAHAAIKGPKELHVHEGSKLRLHCTVEDATEPLLYVFWFHNTTMVNHHPDRPIEVTTKRFSSTLSIASVRRSDAGQYRCEPHLAVPANVTIHVLAGENPAAMQRGRDGIADRDGSSDDAAAEGKASVGTQVSAELPLHFLAAAVSSTLAACRPQLQKHTMINVVMLTAIYYSTSFSFIYDVLEMISTPHTVMTTHIRSWILR